jgi:hypothetical protein
VTVWYIFHILVRCSNKNLATLTGFKNDTQFGGAALEEVSAPPRRRAQKTGLDFSK